ncbi:MATE family efflux transporter [Wenyingzhuangia sp. 2_MG-2023]|uniref:MATE family efflux transporter n=1 Tax=Wenyingzhuangia sp. 2_MG-2023 TaxID=3062639 RepID=UPI0026E278A2|nr:MATE family efflux transporter [Wenyingzhuangia sp. 2_MG-2023]MDO6738563.1 MATE family efflux transporter [Wenyingzhuangia sp. 2_MG-2023]MDO6803214.1 MATE family efflux transporter [Wenyingzhuangia sp. 1_MG-2023]
MNFTQYTKEFKTNIVIAVPIMLGQLGNVLVGFADNIMVGELGAPALAAVSLANSIFFILMGLGVGFSFAITPLIAESDSAENYLDGKKNYQHGVVLLTIIGVVLTAILLLLQPMMKLMNQPEEVVTLALPYYEIIAYSMVPLLIFQAIKQFTDGLSQTKYAMIAILGANSINILLNYMLIYGKLGAPMLGIDGAAYGTLVSRILMIFILLYFIAKKKEFAPYNMAVSWWNIEKERVLKIVKLGYPAALQMFFEIGIFASGVLLAGMLGTQEQAANQIALNLSTMTFMVATGMSVTATIRVANQKGLKDYFNLKRIAVSTIWLMIIIAIIAAIGFMSLRAYLPWIYIDDKEVADIASKLLIIAGLFQISDGIQVVVLGALRGLQDMVIPMWLVFISYWIIGFPVCYYLGILTDLGTFGIWIGLLVGLTVSSILLFLRFQHLTKRLLLSENS